MCCCMLESEERRTPVTPTGTRIPAGGRTRTRPVNLLWPTDAAGDSKRFKPERISAEQEKRVLFLPNSALCYAKLTGHNSHSSTPVTTGTNIPSIILLERSEAFQYFDDVLRFCPVGPEPTFWTQHHLLPSRSHDLRPQSSARGRPCAAQQRHYTGPRTNNSWPYASPLYKPAPVSGTKTAHIALRRGQAWPRVSGKTGWRKQK